MIPNLIGSRWQEPDSGVSTLLVFNPATGEVIDQVPLSGSTEVGAAVTAAAEAFTKWSRTSVMERVRLMFAYKAILEQPVEDLAAIIPRHHGQTLHEAGGAVTRGTAVG